MIKRKQITNKLYKQIKNIQKIIFLKINKVKNHKIILKYRQTLNII